MSRGMRQGCPASGFLFASAFDPIFRWLQEAVIPRNPDGLDFPQPAQCAYADDLAVAALSFRGLMAALARAFRTVDRVAEPSGCCWVQHGSDESLVDRQSDNCEDVHQMLVVKYAWLVSTSSASRPAIELPRVRTR